MGKDSKRMMESYQGFLTNSYTEDFEIDIYGYCTPLNLKIILLLQKNYGSNSFSDQNIIKIMREVKEFYK